MFRSGVIEGFNGRPWNARQRHQLFGWMRSWKLNTYLYAAKGDLKQRQCWRELYGEMELAELGALIRDCQWHGLHFVYSLNPSFDFNQCSEDRLAALRSKVRQVLDLGCRHFGLLFDDLPEPSDGQDPAALRALAEAHGTAANELARFVAGQTGDSQCLFCPPSFCHRPTAQHAAYMGTIGDRLDAAIQVLSTVSEGIPETISPERVQAIASQLNRKPMIWDNLYANDYDPQRLHLGPYTGRSPELRQEAQGILIYPNCQLEVNFVPLRTLAMFLNTQTGWESHSAYRQALNEWLPLFDAVENYAVTLEDLELLGDLFNLPFEFGRQTSQLLEDLRWLLRTSPEFWDVRFKRFDGACRKIDRLAGRATYLRNRELFFALYPSLSRMKTELALARARVNGLRTAPHSDHGMGIPNSAAKIVRGGLVNALQQLLPRD